jgi:hypothetical protein
MEPADRQEERLTSTCPEIGSDPRAFKVWESAETLDLDRIRYRHDIADQQALTGGAAYSFTDGDDLVSAQAGCKRVKHVPLVRVGRFVLGLVISVLRSGHDDRNAAQSSNQTTKKISRKELRVEDVRPECPKVPPEGQRRARQLATVCECERPHRHVERP